MEKDTTINELMEFLQEHMLTRTEAANFATKDDLKNFATKDDLKNFATKDDLKALRQEMRDEFASIKDEFSSVRNDLSEIKQRLTALEKRTIEDADAAALEIVQLHRRVTALEEQVMGLQRVRA